MDTKGRLILSTKWSPKLGTKSDSGLSEFGNFLFGFPNRHYNQLFDLNLKYLVSQWSLKWPFLYLSSPLLLQLVDNECISISTDVDLGKVESDFNSTICLFNWVFLKFLLASNSGRLLYGYPSQEKWFTVEVRIN